MVLQNIERLEWDSDFFGYEVGRININDVAAFELDCFLEQSNKFKLIYVFSDELINFSNFKLVDKKVVLHQVIEDRIIQKELVAVSFNKELHDYDMIINLALESGVYSRFFIDKNFNNNEYVKLYSCWIENAINKINSFEVIVMIMNDVIVGFTTLNRKSDTLADIGLVAVTQEYRGLGIGKTIIRETISRARQFGYSEIQVVTQFDNKAALQLYKSSNFKIEKITNIYHFWNI